MCDQLKNEKSSQGQAYGEPQLEAIASDFQMLRIVEEIVHQNRMILEVFGRPQIVMNVEKKG